MVAMAVVVTAGAGIVAVAWVMVGSAAEPRVVVEVMEAGAMGAEALVAEVAVEVRAEAVTAEEKAGAIRGGARVEAVRVEAVMVRERAKAARAAVAMAGGRAVVAKALAMVAVATVAEAQEAEMAAAGAGEATGEGATGVGARVSVGKVGEATGLVEMAAVAMAVAVLVGWVKGAGAMVVRAAMMAAKAVEKMELGARVDRETAVESREMAAAAREGAKQTTPPVRNPCVLHPGPSPKRRLWGTRLARARLAEHAANAGSADLQKGGAEVRRVATHSRMAHTPTDVESSRIALARSWCRSCSRSPGRSTGNPGGLEAVAGAGVSADVVWSV